MMRDTVTWHDVTRVPQTLKRVGVALELLVAAVVVRKGWQWMRARSGMALGGAQA